MHRRTTPPRLAPDPDAALHELLEGVTPLGRVNRAHVVRPAPDPVPRQSLADEAEALRQSRSSEHPGPAAWDLGLDVEPHQSFVRAGLNPDLLRKLRRGHWVVQAELDLHRLNSHEAHEALTAFLKRAVRDARRCVRVIHGKGLSSPSRVPVLKSKVRRWLQHREEVLAYCEPRPVAGGGGAVVVLLRAPKSAA